MSIKPTTMAISAAISFALLWVICSATVHFFPGPMMLISGHMVHANLSDMNWTLTWSGFFIGLIAWSGVAGISVWLVAVIYNMLK
jgi:hypothetical protein